LSKTIKIILLPAHRKTQQQLADEKHKGRGVNTTSSRDMRNEKYKQGEHYPSANIIKIALAAHCTLFIAV